MGDDHAKATSNFDWWNFPMSFNPFLELSTEQEDMKFLLNQYKLEENKCSMIQVNNMQHPQLG